MRYEEWSQLKSEMAVQVFCMDAAEMMVPAAESEITARNRKARSDGNSTADQFATEVQQWRDLEYRMGQALIALGKLGYTISHPVEPAAAEGVRKFLRTHFRGGTE